MTNWQVKARMAIADGHTIIEWLLFCTENIYIPSMDSVQDSYMTTALELIGI
jgi:hypothetical protein